MAFMILFPSDFFNTNRVDAEYKREYDVAAGLFDVNLFNYDKWFNAGKLLVKHKTEQTCTAIYRGWMMTPEQYERFYHQLLKVNIRLVTDPDQYARLHQFPNVYDVLKEDTAGIKTFPLHERIDVEKIKQTFPRFMVKDYVKSVKGSKFPAFFDQNVTQEEFDRWMDVFYQYRGSLLTGGICIKEYLDLKHYGEHTNEYRVFYFKHKPVSIERNSGQTEGSAPPEDLIEKYCCLDSEYYTIDYAELQDGTWKIIEACDGGVSGLPNNQDCEQYYRDLFVCLQ